MSHLQKLIAGWHRGSTLPQEFYLSEDIYQSDIDSMLMRHWICAGHDSMIPAPGDFFVFEMDRESVILIRGQDGAVRALMNVCRHRGSRVCYGEAGQAEGGTLICPYHGWVYNIDGSLRFARSMPADFDKRPHGLKPVSLRVIAGLIFICFAPDPPGLDAVEDTINHTLKPHGWDRAKVIHREVYRLDANWKLAIENQMECYHCAPSHPDYSRLHSQAKPGVEDLTGKMLARTAALGLDIRIRDQWALKALPGQEADYSARYAMSAGAVTASEDGRPVAPVMGDFTEYDGGTTFVYAGPVSFFLAYTDYGAIFRFTPKSHNRTEVHVTWLVDQAAREGSDFDKDRVTWLWRITSQADKDIIEKNQLGVASRFYEPGPYCFPIESSTHRFTEWYLHDLEKYAAAPPIGRR